MRLSGRRCPPLFANSCVHSKEFDPSSRSREAETGREKRAIVDKKRREAKRRLWKMTYPEGNINKNVFKKKRTLSLFVTLVHDECRKYSRT